MTRTTRNLIHAAAYEARRSHGVAVRIPIDVQGETHEVYLRKDASAKALVGHEFLDGVKITDARGNEVMSQGEFGGMLERRSYLINRDAMDKELGASTLANAYAYTAETGFPVRMEFRNGKEDNVIEISNTDGQTHLRLNGSEVDLLSETGRDSLAEARDIVTTNHWYAANVITRKEATGRLVAEMNEIARETGNPFVYRTESGQELTIRDADGRNEYLLDGENITNDRAAEILEENPVRFRVAAERAQQIQEKGTEDEIRETLHMAKDSIERDPTYTYTFRADGKVHHMSEENGEIMITDQFGKIYGVDDFTHDGRGNFEETESISARMLDEAKGVTGRTGIDTKFQAMTFEQDVTGEKTGRITRHEIEFRREGDEVNAYLTTYEREKGAPAFEKREEIKNPDQKMLCDAISAEREAFSKQLDNLADTEDIIHGCSELSRYGNGAVKTELQTGEMFEIAVDKKTDIPTFRLDGKEISANEAAEVIGENKEKILDAGEKKGEYLAMANAEVEMGRQLQQTRSRQIGDWHVSYLYNKDSDDITLMAAKEQRDAQGKFQQTPAKSITLDQLSEIIRHNYSDFVTDRNRELVQYHDALQKNGGDILERIENKQERELLLEQMSPEDKNFAEKLDEVGNEARNANEPITGYDKIGRKIAVVPETRETALINDGMVGYDVFINGKQKSLEDITNDRMAREFLEEKGIDLDMINDLKNEKNMAKDVFIGKDGKEHTLEFGNGKILLDGKETDSAKLMNNAEAMQKARGMAAKIGRGALKTAGKAAEKGSRLAGQGLKSGVRAASGWIKEAAEVR